MLLQREPFNITMFYTINISPVVPSAFKLSCLVCLQAALACMSCRAANQKYLLRNWFADNKISCLKQQTLFGLLAGWNKFTLSNIFMCWVSSILVYIVWSKPDVTTYHKLLLCSSLFCLCTGTSIIVWLPLHRFVMWGSWIQIHLE